MSRVKQYSDELVLEKLEEFLMEMDSCQTRRSSLSFEKFAEFLQKNGIPISSNVLRHRKAIATKFAEAKCGRPSIKEEAAGPSLEERHKKLVALVEEYFVRGTCNAILNKSGDLKIGKLPEVLKPEIAEKAIITPKSKPFDNEISKHLTNFMRRTEE